MDNLPLIIAGLVIIGGFYISLKISKLIFKAVILIIALGVAAVLYWDKLPF